ncbi:MAG: L,D-transpeptidase [bacterium]
MIINCLLKMIIVLLSLSFLGCASVPVPPEVKEVEIQEHNLWKAGAEAIIPEEYGSYKTAIRAARERLIAEKARFGWFRDYKPIQEEFRGLLRRGGLLLERIEEEKASISKRLDKRINFFHNRIRILKRLSSCLNEGRLVRAKLIRAEILLENARRLAKKERYKEAEAKLRNIPEYTAAATEILRPVINRYSDRAQIRKWQKHANEAIKESKTKGIYSILVSKVEKELVLLKNGRPSKTYPVELGKNGFRDKLHRGDMATPEGRYRITKKLPKSKYHKALVINYPNEDDRRNFYLAKKKGYLSKRVGIGGLIEIHGGGSKGMTYGCVAMENRDIEELFARVNVGTPVTIIGTCDYDNSIVTAMNGF